MAPDLHVAYREVVVNTDISIATSVCFEYEQLLSACERAMQDWRNGSTEITKSEELDRKAVFDELLRLQAEYARAYSRLAKHKDNCHICSFVTKMGRRVSSDEAMNHAQ